MEVLQKALTIVFVINCIFLILLILLQSNRSAGMSLFGGGGSQSAFGSSSGNLLTKATGVMAAIFLFLGLSIAWLGTGNNTKIQELQKEFINEKQTSEDQSKQNATTETEEITKNTKTKREKDSPPVTPPK